MFDVTQPVDFDAAIQKLADKDALPLSLKSEQIQRLMSADLRDRSFFSAQVANTELLDEFKKAVNEIVSGKSNVASQRAKLKQVLQKFQYVAPAGKAGTLEDLSSNERLNLILKTNTSMVRGYGAYQEGMHGPNLRAFPGQELTRIGYRKVPRPWRERWDLARAATPDTTALSSSVRMVALKNDPIWTAISRFGVPWPPFDFNSGMGVEDVGFTECLDLGLIKERTEEKNVTPQAPATTATVMKQLTSPQKLLPMNAKFAASVKDTSPDLVSSLLSTLFGASIVGTEIVLSNDDDDTYSNRSTADVMEAMLA